MTLHIDRRALIKTAAWGIAAIATPGVAQLLAARGFTHGVASGEPGANSVLLWTRFVAAGETQLGIELAADAEFGRIVARGEATADPERDCTARATVHGLAPDRWYFYRFTAPDGSRSPIGRTRTLPEGMPQRFALGVFSCANLPFGWFNAYAHAAARDDLDLIVHLGDYLYEYPRGRYPEIAQALAGRVIEPASEIVALADYRLRYASYRADPDLAALHAAYPMIAIPDDHEFANDAWAGGAQNHQPEEGDWAVRKAAAIRAHREWLPISDGSWARYRIGGLATLHRLETRATARMEQLNYSAVFGQPGDIAAGLRDFRDGVWSDPARTLLGTAQEAWLAEGLRGDTRWHILAQQVIMGTVNAAPETEAMLAGAPEEVRARAGALIAAARAGLPLNLDAWDGYPAARARLLRASLEADADLIVLAGDSHNAWAFDLAHEGARAGVEFAVHSVTSPGFEGFLPAAAPADVAASLIGASPNLRWADTAGRGYMTVTLTPDEARAEWLFLDTVRERSTRLARRHSLAARHGARALAA
ncbi:MAG: alkaline phosphatase D family protein [Sphingomonadaceae bacterium]|nr:alkaline phosphatase D family protein [Sphingomonadaceae bacterium]